MEQGDLGVVSHRGHDWFNPLGLAVNVDDVELVLAVKESGLVDGLIASPVEVLLDPEGVFGRVADRVDDHIEDFTDIGRRIAVRKAREILRRNGLDIADRPVSVELGRVYETYTSFHVLVPIIVLPTEDPDTGELPR